MIAISMADFWDEMNWWQVLDDGESFWQKLFAVLVTIGDLPTPKNIIKITSRDSRRHQNHSSQNESYFSAWIRKSGLG